MTDFSQHGLVDVNRRVQPTDGAWPAVELVGNLIELFLAVDRQIGALGQVLPDQVVDVCANAQLPRAVRVAELDFHARIRCQLRMLGHLLALVIRQHLADGLGNAAQLGRKVLQGRGVRQLGRHHQARAALDQHNHSRTVAGALDKVTFAVPRKRPVVLATGGRAWMLSTLGK